MFKILSPYNFLNEKYTHINEGGAAGHMMHPYDDIDLTFNDFKILIEAGLSGKLDFEDLPSEKTDGQNIFITMKDGQTYFARNKGDLIYPMDLNGLIDKFKSHPSETVRDTFILAAKDLSKQLSKLNDKTQEKYFNRGLNFINTELIYSGNPNVINYDKDIIQFHNIMHTDGKGKIIKVDTSSPKEILDILSDVEATVGDIFTIIPPRILKLRKSISYEKDKKRLLSKVNTLRDKYKLSDTDMLIDYHVNWWKKEIEENFGDLGDDIKLGLLKRWAYQDKGSFNFRQLNSILDKDYADKLKKFDKVDLKKKYKENIKPFESIFLELGAIVLKHAVNILALDHNKERDRLVKSLNDTINNIKKEGLPEQIDLLNNQLEKLKEIGGIESIVPVEGLVFKYNNKIYKLTGTFAPLNQIIGILKYSR